MLGEVSSDSPQFDAKEYWESRLKGDYRLAGVGYRGLGEPFNRWMYRVRSRVFRRVMRSRIPSPAVVDAHDMGSGTGFYIDEWRVLGIRSIMGSDVTTKAVEELRRRYPDQQFRQLDLGAEHDAELEAGRYGAVSAFDVLFHITDDQAFRRALRNAYERVAPGGVFVFSDNFVHKPENRQEHHVNRELAAVESAVREVGFEIEARLPMFVLMNEPVDSASRVHRLWWMALVQVLSRAPELGYVLGAVLYPFELVLTRVLREGPSTEMMICRRPAGT